MRPLRVGWTIATSCRAGRRLGAAGPALAAGRWLGLRRATRVGGDALHRARSARGLTQSQLARIIDVSGGERVSECERGVRAPAVRLIPAVAAALGVTHLEFLALPNGVDLKALRLASGKTSTEIAQQTQVSSATYLRWGVRQIAGDPRSSRSAQSGEGLGHPSARAGSRP